MPQTDSRPAAFELSGGPVDVDTGPLAEFAASVESQYRALAERIESADDGLTPDDRMYM